MSETDQPEPNSNRSSEDYPVRLQNFEGPLDLLLHLIKKHEIDVYDIPIALVTQAVPRLPRPDAGAQPRHRGRVPRDGGDADPRQVAHAAAAARSDAGGSGGGSARGAHPPAARAPEVQGRRRAAAREGNPAQRAVAAARRPAGGGRRRSAGAGDRSRSVQPDVGVPAGARARPAAAARAAAAGTDFD